MEIPIEKIWMAQKMMIKRCKVCCSVGIGGSGSGCGLGQGGRLRRYLERRYFPAVVKHPKSSRWIRRWVRKGSRGTEGIRKVLVVMPPHC